MGGIMAAIISSTSAADAQTSISQEQATTLVKPIYAALTASSPADVRTFLENATTEDWRNCGTNDSCEMREETIARWSGRITRIPNFTFDIQEVLVSGNKIIVRSQATGTPTDPFMGVATDGRSFRLMTVDIHEVSDGKITRTYHVEDWSRALRQLKGEM
ncbi:ester cyclase [Agrobacterium salinitolerans]|nr:ester cyclase [Agrobacterium salinitolerans]